MQGFESGEVRECIDQSVFAFRNKYWANIREAFYAHGKADFIAKLQIALKECSETEYWIELILESGYYHDIVGEQNFFLRRGVWVLVEKTDDSYVEMGTYSSQQRKEIIKEIEVYNETIREDLYTCIMRHEAVSGHDMRDYGDDGRRQVGDGRVGAVHQGESDSERIGSDQSSKHDNGRNSQELK